MMPEVDISSFQSNYRSARKMLLNHIGNIPGELVRQHQSFTHPLPGPDSQPLYMDWLWLGQHENPERVLVLISGTHGVEGFAGSAIQCQYLCELTRQLQLHPELAVIIIHALNPWGFAWLRRADHEGIDLNRNFINFDAPLPTNPGYDRIHAELFNDTSTPIDTILNKLKSKPGQDDFDATITRGQYQHANGPFFGGHAPSWSRQMLEQACTTSILHNAQRVAVIDLHTGLGPYGYGEVINDHIPGTAGFDMAHDCYGANAQSAFLGESCSAVKTGLLDYFWHELLGKRGCFVTLEYGTYALHKLLTLTCEEQRYHNSYAAKLQQRNIEHETVSALVDFFYPRERSWCEQVIFRAGQIIQLALQGILK